MEYNHQEYISNTILDIIEECVLYRDLEGKKIYHNKSYYQQFIYKSGETQLYEDYEIVKVKDKEVINSKSKVIYELKVKNCNGDTTYFEVTKMPIIDKKQNLIGILDIMKDISYKHELEKLRNGFFSNIKHEFRTPLNMIFSSIQLLDYKCKMCNIGNCKDCFINTLQLININSLRILKLSNNFIDLANIQTGCMDFSPRNHDIVSFIESICERINNYKKFNHINLIFDTNVEEYILSFDTDKIERVILNLISNAIKFNKQDGFVFVNIEVEKDYTNISIKDTGIGISKDKIDSTFESFSNLENRLTKVSEGSGVGLALSKALIEMHNGDINVKSELEKGSEFIISIPNIINKNEEIDISYNKIDSNSLERIKMEFSDIYA